MTQDPRPWLCSAGAANQDVLHFAVKTSTPPHRDLGKGFFLCGALFLPFLHLRDVVRMKCMEVLRNLLERHTPARHLSIYPSICQISIEPS